MLIPTSYAAEKNYTLQYARCNELLSSPYISHSIAFWEKKCIILLDKETQELILLSEKQDIIESALIQESLLQELKTKYYRGEKLRVEYSWELKDISHSHILGVYEEKSIEKILTPKGNYTIQLKGDQDFVEKVVLSKYCRADSFFLTCDTGFYQEIQDKISTTFQDIFLRGDALFEKDESFLNTEKQKIQKIRSLYKTLWDQYKDSQKILYLLESIDYKLSIYESIINNTLKEKETERKILTEKQKMKGNYYMHLWDDIFIYTEKLYIYFYYGNTLANTIQNDLSHFSSDEILKLWVSLEDRSLLAYHIIEKYKLIYEKNLPQNMRLLEKSLHTWTSSIILSEDAKRYTLNGKLYQIQSIWENIYGIILENTSKEIQLLRNSGRNSTQVIFTLDRSVYSDIVSYTIRWTSLELSLKLLSWGIEKKTLSL